MRNKEQILDEIKNTPIIVYIKGEKEQPACRWSAQIVHILNQYPVDYKGVNVLLDPDIRRGISEYSDWPTIPQLFVKGEFVGGGDIVKELHQTGQLENIF